MRKKGLTQREKGKNFGEKNAYSLARRKYGRKKGRLRNTEKGKDSRSFHRGGGRRREGEVLWLLRKERKVVLLMEKEV